MAEKTVISIEVDGVQKSINSVKELKAELKAAQSAALNGDGKAAKRVAELKDKMDDLKDTTKSLQGSGVEKISSSFSLLGQGFKDFDTDKITTGFKGVGSAMKAIPIFLLIEGISYLVENWKELSEGNGLVAKSLQFLGNIFTSITDKIYAFTDAIGLTNTELDKQGEAIKEFADKSNAALNEQAQAFDRQIAVAKVSGKSTVELEKKKQQAIIDTNLLIAKQIEAFVRAGGELDDEKKKQLTASLDFIKNAKVQEYVITETDNKSKQEQYKKYLEKQKEIALNAEKQKALDLQKQKEDDAAIELQSQHAINADKIVEETTSQAELNAQKAALDAAAYEAWLKTEEGKAALKAANLEKDYNDTRNYLQAANNLSDIFFILQLNKVKGNSEQELKIRKNQFIVEKAFKVALITMDGIQGAMKAYALNPLPSPIGIISASLQGIAAAAAAAKVISVPFSGGGGTGAISIPNSLPSAPSSNGTPNITAQQPQTTTTFTGNNNNNFNQPIKTYVVETDLRNSTKTIDRIKEQSTF